MKKKVRSKEDRKQKTMNCWWHKYQLWGIYSDTHNWELPQISLLLHVLINEFIEKKGELSSEGLFLQHANWKHAITPPSGITVTSAETEEVLLSLCVTPPIQLFHAATHLCFRCLLFSMDEVSDPVMLLSIISGSPGRWVSNRSFFVITFAFYCVVTIFKNRISHFP